MGRLHACSWTRKLPEQDSLCKKCSQCHPFASPKLFQKNIKNKNKKSLTFTLESSNSGIINTSGFRTQPPNPPWSHGPMVPWFSHGPQVWYAAYVAARAGLSQLLLQLPEVPGPAERCAMLRPVCHLLARRMSLGFWDVVTRCYMML